MKRYFQEGFRDMDGDVIIHQYTEVDRPSGLVVPQHISTVCVARQISTEGMIALMGQEFYYEPDASAYDCAEVTELVRKTLRFSVGPERQKEFCRRSVKTIVDAFRVLTYHDITPHIGFESMKPTAEFADDDREMFQVVAATVNDIVNEVDQSSFLGGQYL